MNRITDYKKLQDDIVQWIRDYATTNNIKSLVVGVSGGIDSAVVSTLCAMTGLKVRCIVLPIHSNIVHTELAENHLLWLSGIYNNVRGTTIDISDVYDAMAGNFFDDLPKQLANIKSRLRMTMLYAKAEDCNGIVVGTGNKVEDFGIGFYTKYGDGGVDISPIADLYKTEVRELGSYMGISQDILDAHPTDGLWVDGRTDEDQIGTTYEELEWAMEQSEHLEIEHFDVSPQLRNALIIYRKLHNQNLHKMLPIPIYKLTV